MRPEIVGDLSTATLAQALCEGRLRPLFQQAPIRFFALSRDPFTDITRNLPNLIQELVLSDNVLGMLNHLAQDRLGLA